MGQRNLQDWVQGWQDGDKWVPGWRDGSATAYWRVCEWLWGELNVKTVAFVVKLCDDGDDRDKLDKAKQLVSGAFWAAMEEMDLKVSDGILLTEATGETREVKRKNGEAVLKKLFLGKVSKRTLTERPRFAWRGEKEFRALFRMIWRARCWDAVRREGHQYTVTTHEYDAQHQVAEEVKKVQTWQHISLTPTRNEDAEPQGGAYEDEIAGDFPGGEHLVLDLDALCALTDGFAQMAVQLTFQRKGSLAETAEALILGIKWQVVQTKAPNAVCDIGQLRSSDIEELLQAGDLSEIDFDEDRLWSFAQKHLALKQDAFYQRRGRLYTSVCKLPCVPEVLRGAVGLLWRRDMYNWVEDCGKTVPRLQQQHSAEADVLKGVEVYLRWTFAQGHTSHRSARLAWIQTAAPEELFKVNNPALLIPTYPTTDHFQQFVQAQKWNQAHMMALFPSLREALQLLKQSCDDRSPKRLLTVIDALQESTRDTSNDTEEV